MLVQILSVRYHKLAVSPNSVCPLPCIAVSLGLPVTDRQKIIEGDRADGLIIRQTDTHTDI